MTPWSYYCTVDIFFIHSYQIRSQVNLFDPAPALHQTRSWIQTMVVNWSSGSAHFGINLGITTTTFASSGKEAALVSCLRIRSWSTWHRTCRKVVCLRPVGEPRRRNQAASTTRLAGPHEPFAESGRTGAHAALTWQRPDRWSRDTRWWC